MPGICAAVSSGEVLSSLPKGSVSAVILREPGAAGLVHALGAKALISTPPVILPEEFDAELSSALKALDSGADGVELCDLGLLRRLKSERPGTFLLAGPMANVYNRDTLSVLLSEGVREVCPSIELDIQGLADLCGSGAPVMATVYGPLPLSFGRASLPEQAVVWPEAELRASGRALVSSKPYDLYDDLPALWAIGIRSFRIEDADAETVLRFKAALDAAAAGKPPPPRAGLAKGTNGYLRGSAGCSRSEVLGTPTGRIRLARARSSISRADPLPSRHGLPALLAPAGNMDCMAAACANGADGVYVGLKGWSLRPGVFEFDEEDLRRAVDAAGRAGAWVAACVNISLLPGEEDAALEAVRTAKRCGCRAVIVGDLGLLSAARAAFPDLPLHASVQLGATNAEAAQFLHEHGADVVVLSRSIETLEELRAVRKKTAAPLEVFVHGDVCTFHDGKCHLTSYLRRERVVPGQGHGLASVVGCSNRGECTLACKQPFKGGTFRRRDLERLSWVPELVRMGIAILKIEGRQFGPDYVSMVTKAYRKALDRSPEVNALSELEGMREHLAQRDISYEFQRQAWLRGKTEQ
ncbi:MAG: U32 family peptidase [Elusimicrobiota bacterium]